MGGVPPDLAPGVTAVVLCGGSSRRFGADKTRAVLGDAPLLDHVLRGLPEHWPVLCVGEQRRTLRRVQWCREEPPGGGPVAGVAAALPHVATPCVVILGGDMPYAGGSADVLAAQLAREAGVEAVTARDGDGRPQPLLAAYRTEALRAAVPDEPAGTPLMRLLDALRSVAGDVEARASADIDTPDDLERARHRLSP